MKTIMIDTDERRWQAVCERDASADGQFVFAVLTTGVCCRPSCRSRRGKMFAFILMWQPRRRKAFVRANAASRKKPIRSSRR